MEDNKERDATKTGGGWDSSGRWWEQEKGRESPITQERT